MVATLGYHPQQTKTIPHKACPTRQHAFHESDTDSWNQNGITGTKRTIHDNPLDSDVGREVASEADATHNPDTQGR